MTLSTQTSKTAFAGNGVTCVFPLPFPFIREADIRALLRQDGLDTPLLPGAHYSLSGAGSPTSGSLTMHTPPATGQTLVAWRAPAIVQEVDYVENSAFPAETHEAALDLLTMICQSLQEQIDRAVLYPVSTPAEDILDSSEFLDITQANKTAAQAAQLTAEGAAQNADASAASASVSAARAAAAAANADISAGGGTVRVSAGDVAAQALSAKLLAGNGLSETIENPGAAEALRLAVALAANPGLEFASSLLRVKAGTGLVLGAGGLAVDVGATANKLVQLDSSGRLPAVDASQLTGIVSGDAQARDLAVMDAFITQFAAGRASGPVPGGYLHLFATDELATKTGATYDSVNKRYVNKLPTTAVPYSTGTVIGNGIDTGVAFNGVTSASFSVGGITYVNTSGPLYCGKGWGTSKLITGFNVWSASSSGFGTGGSADITFTLLGSNTNDPATATSLGSTSHANAAGIEVSFSDLAIASPYAYHWVKIQSSGYSQIGGVEVEFLESFPANNATLVPAAVTAGAAPAFADLYLLHRAVDSVTLGTDLKVRASRDNGANWTGYGTLAKLCDFDASYALLKATAGFAGLSGGASIKWEVTSLNNKSQQWRAVAALLR